uniref:Uncharacterized protein n=1 Tax=Ciona intestinalis TaxID=7719 RepID=H2XM72_CIOIN
MDIFGAKPFVVSTQEASIVGGHSRTESLGSDVFSNAPFSIATGKCISNIHPATWRSG